jgi:putative ABC transport system substrate-binding protein
LSAISSRQFRLRARGYLRAESFFRAQAAKAATTTIPIVFISGSDPIESGLVSSLGRPTGNVTGVSLFSVPLISKRLELLRASTYCTAVGVLVNPSNPNAGANERAIESAAKVIGLTVAFVGASGEPDFEDTFMRIAQQRFDALIASADGLFASRRKQLVMLAARHRVPTMYFQREFVDAGGLISYGGTGLVTGLARPGGNTTGFTVFEYGLSPKWLALLKEIAPRVTRAAVFRDPTVAAQIGLLRGIQSVAPSLRMELSLIDNRDIGEMERAVAAFAREPNGGQIVLGGFFRLHRESMITLAAKHQLPTVYTDRAFVTAGGLTSYGPDRVEQYRQAAGYVDRILRGEKPADLPVQAPTKYELVINLKTAKALGLEVPPTLLARTDEVIE